MTIRHTLAACAVAAGLVFALPPLPADAASPQARLGAAAQGDTLVTHVHGGHGAKCRWGTVHRWSIKARHRHLGAAVEPCGKRHDGPGVPNRWKQRNCFKIGPIWYCP